MTGTSPGGLLARTLAAPLHRGLVSGRRREVLAAHLAKLIPAGPAMTGLDVGCGSGEVARRLMAIRPELSLTGLEVLPRAGAVIPAAAFDGLQLPFPDGHADFVLLIHVLHHAADPARLLADCRRVARRFVIVIDHYRESWWDQARLAGMDWAGNRAEHHLLPYTYLSRRQWDDLFRQTGLVREEETGDPGLYPFPLSRLCGGRLHFAARLVPAPAR